MNTQWHKYNLGGYETNLEYKELVNPYHERERSHYEKKLAIWKKKRVNIKNVPDYCQHLLQKGDTVKRLVKLTSYQEIHTLRFSLQKYCQTITRPCFYIDSPDDLICLAPVLQRQSDNTGFFQPGPAGLLYNFLSTYQGKEQYPILIINYHNFDADDIVRYNHLLDDARNIDGISLAKDVIIIGLQNIYKSNCYQGEDFYSRFTIIESFPLTGSIEFFRNSQIELKIVDAGNQIKS
ncbi:MAG: hypothetical protein LEGION0398_MBIBDBAK_01400 [Legionellaceae bacterium]